MILGLPVGFLIGVWGSSQVIATWPGLRLALAVLAMVFVGLAAGLVWVGRRPAWVAGGFAVAGLAGGLLRAVAAEPPTPSPITIDIVGVRATVIADAVWIGRDQEVPLQIGAIARTGDRWVAAEGVVSMRTTPETTWVPGAVIEATVGSRYRTGFHAGQVRQIGVAPALVRDDWAGKLRRAFATPIERWVPEPEASLLVGIVIGDRTGLPLWLRDAFATTGAAHMVAISGYNVALVAGAVTWLTHRGRRRNRPIWRLMRAALVSITLWAFVGLVGTSGSVLRAAVMAQMLYLAYATGRRGAAGGALLWASVGLTIWDATTLNDLGWQLSFLGAAGLIWLSGPLAIALTPGPTWPRLIHVLWPVTVREVVSATIAAQACVLPVVANIAGGLPLTGMIATTPGVLLVPPIMLMGGIAGLVGAVSGEGSVVTAGLMPLLATLAWIPTAALTRLIAWGATLPWASVHAIPWEWWATGPYLLALLLLMAVAESTPRPPPVAVHDGWRVMVPVAITVATIGAVFGFLPHIGTARAASSVVATPGVRVIIPAISETDDAIMAVVQIASGPRIVIGGGITATGAVQTIGTTLRPWDRTIDAIVVPTARSVAGVATIATRYPVRAILDLTAHGRSPLLEGVRRIASGRSIAMPAVDIGQTVTVGGAVTVTAIGTGPSPIGSATTGPSTWPPVATRLRVGEVDLTVMPDVQDAAMWIAHAPPHELLPLTGIGGSARWLLVPYQAWRTHDLAVIREAVGPTVTFVQGAPAPWRSVGARPVVDAAAWWITAIDGGFDTNAGR